MKKRIKLSLIISTVVVGAIIFYFLQPYFMPQNLHSEENHNSTVIQPAKRYKISALGRLEPKGGVIEIGAPGENSILERLLVVEGQEVKAGEILALMRNYPVRLAEKNKIESELRESIAIRDAETLFGEAGIEEAKAKIEHLQEIVPLEIESQEAKVRKLDVRLENEKKDLSRKEELMRKTTISERELDYQSSTTRQVAEELDSAKALLKKLKKGFDIDLKTAKAHLKKAKANLVRAQVGARVESLEKRLALATEQLNLSIIKAPINGKILLIVKFPGENVIRQPIFKMGDTSQMYAVAQVYENDIRFVETGQRSQIISSALPEKVSGTVEQIGNIIFKNDVLSDDPTAAIDARVVEVKIRLDNNKSTKGLSNMTVDVDIFLEK